MKENSFVRLWGYLKVYKAAVLLAVFLKIVSVVMSVLEPFVLGLAITELTQNLLDMAKGVPGAAINSSYVAWIMLLYFIRALYMRLVLTFLTIHGQMLYRAPFATCAMS